MNNIHQHTMKPHPKISLDNLEASRLIFDCGMFEYVYDSRGYEFARYPKTGNILTEEKSGARDFGVFFGAYDDGDGDFFAFWEEDCFDPPQYLVRANSFEDACYIFCEEFGTKVDPDDADYNTPEKIEEGLNNGSIRYCNGTCTLVHSENVNGRQIKLLRIEGVTQ